MDFPACARKEHERRTETSYNNELMNCDRFIGTKIPHADFGDADCCGCFVAMIRNARADIVCNECGLVYGSVPEGDLDSTLTNMELELPVATALCQHCGSVSLFPGFTEMIAFACQSCGRGTRTRS